MDSWEFSTLKMEMVDLEVKEGNFYSNDEKWYVMDAVKEVARTSEGDIDPHTVYDLCPFVRVYGLYQGATELEAYISKHGVEAARWAEKELKKRQPSQALDAPFVDPANTYGPVVRSPADTHDPVVGPNAPWTGPPPPPPVMPG